MKITKEMQRVLDYLGKDYRPQMIDLEMCVYKKINDEYDIEITGCNDGRKRKMRIHVWQTKPNMYIVEQTDYIRTYQNLKNVLDKLTIKYQNQS